MSSRRTLRQVLSSWAFKPRKFARYTPGFILTLEDIEDRIVPATLPAPTVLTPTPSNAAVALGGTSFNPQVVASPTNALDQVLVATTGTGTTTSVVAQFSTDGGTTWLTVPNFPVINPAVPTNTMPVDPLTAAPYVTASSASVAISRSGEVYFVFLATNAADTSGGVFFTKESSFGGAASTPVALYQWTGVDPALNPTIGVDNNLNSFTDPTTGKIFTDPMAASPGSQTIYVAWNGHDTAGTGIGDGTYFNPTPILMVNSGDDGKTWSNPTPVSGASPTAPGTQPGYLTQSTAYGAAPQIVFSPGTSGAPGSLMFVWSGGESSSSSTIVYDSTQPDKTGVIPQAFTVSATGLPVTIPNAVSPPPPNSPAVADMPQSVSELLTVPAGTLPAGSTLQDLSVELSIVSPDMEDLSVQLIAPDGQSIFLFQNRDFGLSGNQTAVAVPNGQPFSPGVAAPPANNGLGTFNANTGAGYSNTDTVFSDTAARRIDDPNATYPYIGTYRPEGNGAFTQLTSPPAQFLSTLGLNAGNISGTWTLKITDNFADTNNPAQFLKSFGLTFSSITPGLGADHTILNSKGAPVLTAPTGYTFDNSPLTSFAISPTAGIPAGLSIAFDNSLGSFSPYTGQIYIGYTTPGADIDLLAGSLNANGTISFPTDAQQVNDDSPLDNTTEGNKAQFIPAVAVDSTTGTVVVTWYDARLDADNVRAAEYVATSIDGGQTFSSQTYSTSATGTTAGTPGDVPFLSQPKDAIDTITGTQYTLQPVPTNVPDTGADGLGLRQSVVFAGGNIYAYWAGNLNAAGVEILSAHAVTAVGPRVISGDTGPILTSSTVGGITYNNTIAPDGTRGLDGFTITFDRPVDPSTINGNTVQVQYQNPYTAAITVIPTISWTPIDLGALVTGEATEFLVRFAPQYKAGTYSYAVGPAISDRVRGATTSNYIATANTETQYDGFANSDVTSTITVPASVPATETITKVTVSLTIQQTGSQPSTDDLYIALTAPNGQQVVLSEFEGNGITPNFTDTTFSQAAALSISSPFAQAPYTGSFRPETTLFTLDGSPALGTLTALNGSTAVGKWQLEIVNFNGGAAGTLLSWSVNVNVSSPFAASGNEMDQNANGVADEANVDAFAMPDPTTGIPFKAPYVTASLPLIIPGPSVASTSVPNSSPSDPGEVLNGVASELDVTFSRAIDATTTPASAGNPAANLFPFTAADILQIDGPAGVIYDKEHGPTVPLTVTPIADSFSAATGGYTAFAIGFPGQVLSGTYTVQLDANFAEATTAATLLGTGDPVLMDPNENAGINVLNGGNATTGTPLTSTYQASFNATSTAALASLTESGTTVTATTTGNFTLVTGQEIQISGVPIAGYNGTFVITSVTQNGTTVTFTYTASAAGLAPAGSGTATQLATIPAEVGTVPGVADFPLSVADSYTIAVDLAANPPTQIAVQLNISTATALSQHVTDLTAELIAPDGAVLQLFSGVGNPGRTPGTLWFSNTLLEDSATTPIQQGFQPFDSGPYNPQFSLDSAFNGMPATGIWTLRIINAGGQTPSLTSWALTLPHRSIGTGLGETIADQSPLSFRVFNQDPTSSLTQQVWTPVGPASENNPATGNSARTTALAVDPSDPSGNTVYLGGASGGVWKTTDFLTTDPNGPTWIPLTDNGPDFSLNIASIAVFPRNNDPDQSIIFALTGEGNTGSSGIGVLLSEDGGQTWQVLDSTNNTDSPTTGTGNFTSIDSTLRDRKFYGMTGYTIVVDPTAVNDAAHDVIVYMATSSGVWRSNDTGRHWVLMQAGLATDVVLAQGSAPANGNPNLQILYAAFANQGVYMANPAFSALSMVPITGAPGGDGSFINNDKASQSRVPISAPASTPSTGGGGRIELAAPAFVQNNSLENEFYQGWLYALVITGPYSPGSTSGTLVGLYMTKDFGQNWTKISLAQYVVGSPPQAGYGTDDYTLPDHNSFGPPAGSTSSLASQGSYDVAFAIDPTNPNVVYIGGMTQAAIGPNSGILRVDTTGVMDAGAVVAYDNDSKATPGVVQYTAGAGNAATEPVGTVSQTSGAGLGPGVAYGVNNDVGTYENRSGGVVNVGPNTGLLNVLRDPTAPFSASSPLFFTNVASIQNTGVGAHYSGLSKTLTEASTDIHRIITFVDPVTGETRLIVGDDQGVATSVVNGQGEVTAAENDNQGIVTQDGLSAQSYTLPPSIRNGNLQTVQFYSSTAQPSQLAAEIAQALFYGEAQDDGFPQSNSGILQTGLGTVGLNWSGSTGDGSYVTTDQTGSGTEYQYQWPCCGVPGGNDFVLVNGVGRTFGLVQSGDNPSIGQGQWPLTGGYQFAVNPVDPNGMLISSKSGQVFRSTDQGVTWFVVGGNNSPGINPLDGAHASALAFGAPDPLNPNVLDNFLYAGTAAGNVWVSTVGGGTQWTKMSSGLDGSAVEQIIPDPVRGSKDAYAVTQQGVYYIADSTNPADSWVSVTGNLFSLSRPIFGQANPSSSSDETAAIQFGTLSSIAVDWNYAIVDPTNPGKGTFPILYVGGMGGIVRSVDDGKTWQLYPQGTTYTYTDPTTGQPSTISIPAGGYFPAEDVTSLTLSRGNVDPATGQPLQQTGGLNLLTASTYGRGDWVIRLGTPQDDPAIAAVAQYQVVQQSGPQVIGVTIDQQPTATTAGVVSVEFNAPVLASTFTTGEISIKDANGNPFTITGVTPIPNPIAPADYPTVPGSPADYHNLFQVTFFPTTATTTTGFGQIIVGSQLAVTTVIATPGSGSTSEVQTITNTLPVIGLTDLSENVNTVTAVTAAPLPVAVGEEVTIAGVGTVGYDGTFIVTSVATTTTGTTFTYTNNAFANLATDAAGGTVFRTADTFSLNFNGQVTGALPANATALQVQEALVGLSNIGTNSQVAVKAASWAAGVVTVTTSSAPAVPYAVGQTVVISGMTPAAYNGTYTVASVLSPTSFTFALASNPGTAVVFGAAATPNVLVTSVSNAGGTVYTVTFGGALANSSQPQIAVTAPDITDYAGFAMNQNGNGTNGETTVDPNNGGAAADAYHGYLALNLTGTGSNGNLHINMPTTTTAGDPTKVIVSDLDPNTGLPNTGYTGTITLTATINGQEFVATNSPVIGLLTLSEAGSTVTVTTDSPVGFAVNEQVTISGVPTVGYNGTFTVLSVSPTGFTYDDTAASNLPADINADDSVQGTVQGPLEFVAAQAGTPTPLPANSSALPFNYTFTPTDAGTHVFTIYFLAASSPTTGQTLLSAQDISGSPPNPAQANITVTAGHATQFIVTGLPDPVTAGATNNFEVIAADPYGNIDPTYTGTVTLTTTDPHGTMVQTPYTFTSGTGTGFDNGEHTFQATLDTAGPVVAPALFPTGGPETITATDATNPLLKLTGSETVTVLPAAAASLTVTNTAASVVAGTASSFTVTMFDAYGNIATGYTGTVTFSSSDPYPASFAPLSYTFTGRGIGLDNGVHTFTNVATLYTAGPQTITVTDAVDSLTATSNPITVTPAATSQLKLSGFSNPATAGTAGTVTVTAEDQYGNTTPAYTGTVTFTSTDAQAVLPANYTFLSTDAGVHQFPVTLKTAGPSRTGGLESITATDTTTASITGTQTVTVKPAAASTLTLTGFTNPVVAGTPGSFTVTMFDAYGNIAVGYTGTLHFTSTDLQAALPVNYKFLVTDAGVHTFTATLKTAGPSKTGGLESITATDTTNASIHGSQTVTVNPAATAQFVVSGFPNPVTAGVAGTATVTAEDQYGNTTPTYTGTATFTSSDPQAVLPANYTFLATDDGVHQVPVTLKTAGPSKTGGLESITATDTTTASITGSQTVTVNPAAANSLTVTGFPNPVVAGTPGSFAVTLHDAYGNTAVGYTGTVTFTSSDPQAALPANYKFLATDAGVHTFIGTLKTAGPSKTGGLESITATDTTTAAIAGSQTVTVNPAAANSLTVTGFPSPVVAGTPGTATVTALDPYGNTAVGYTGTVTITSSDAQAVLPANYTFLATDAGVHTVPVTLETAGPSRAGGPETITATDTTTASIHGSQTVTVNPAATAQFVVSGYTSPVTAGTSNSFTVTAEDQYGNTTPAYTGTVTFTSTDAQAVLPADYTFLGTDDGVRRFTATLKTAGPSRTGGPETITATDTATASIHGSQTVTVVPAVAASVTLTGVPTPVVAGTPETFTATLYDAYGNTAVGYTGNLIFSSDDPQVVFSPLSYKFGPTDDGTKTFAAGVTLKTAGTRSITATDAADSLSGSETGIVVTPAATSKFLIGYPSPVTAGTSNPFTVTASDPYGNTTPTYTGTVTLSSSDAKHSFAQPTLTFLAADDGVVSTTGTLKTAGPQSITATDTGSITGTQTVTVTAAAAATLTLTGFPTPVVAGTAGDFTVTLTDPYGNVATGYAETVSFTTTDPKGTFAAAQYTFTAADAGTKTFVAGATLKTAGTWDLTATDTANGLLTSTEAGIQVTPAAAATVRVTGVPTAVVAGTANTVTVTLLDPYGNVATGYRGTVALTSTDPQAGFTVTPYTYTAGDAGTHAFAATLKTAGTQSVAATDTAGLTGAETGIVVAPAATAGFVLGGLPATVIIGSSNPLTVTAEDAFGNTTPGYTGTVAFSSSDPKAGLPAAATLTNGVGTFTVVLNTPGTQSVGATDAANPALTSLNALTTNVISETQATLPGDIIVGSGAGGSPDVLVYNNTAAPVYGFTPFGISFAAGTRVAIGDVTGDGENDYVVGTGPGVPSQVEVIDGKTDQVIFSYQPFESTFTGGVFVAVGDIGHTGVDDIVITPDVGGGPRVVILQGKTFQPVASFYGIDDPNFRGGARAAVGDINGDGYADLIVAAGFGGGPRVSIYDGKSLAAGQEVNLVPDFFIFGGSDAENLRDGVFIALGDINGDGFDDIIAGGGPGGGPRVLIVSGKTLLTEGSTVAIDTPIANFFAGDSNARGGVRVAAANLDGDQYADLVAGNGETEGSNVTAYAGSSLAAGGTNTLFTIDPYPGFQGGVYVG